MKQLTQAIFDDAPEWVKSAAIDGDGYFYSIPKSKLRVAGLWWGYRHIPIATCDYIGNFDATNWQNSAIDREVMK